MLNGSGTAVSPQLLEVMGRDVGLAASGFTNNFAYGTLALANNTYAQLVDQSQNTTSGGPDALYVNSLIVPAGATLDLNAFHLYARVSEIDGTVLNGVVEQVPDSGPLALGGPMAGAIDPAGQLDAWTFYGLAGRTMTIYVDPAVAPFRPRTRRRSVGSKCSCSTRKATSWPRQITG